jgi:hypothetical protein
LSSETYTVTVTDANGCSNAASTLVLVNELPVPLIYYAEISGNFNNDGSICNGDQTGLSVNVGTSYIWNNGAVSSSINVAPSVSTTYSVTVTDNNGCSASTQTSVSVFTLPTPSITANETSGTTANDGIVCLGSSASLSTGSFNAYVWDNGNTTASVSVSPNSTTSYTVTVTSTAGCTASVSDTITVNTLPSASVSLTETSGIAINDGLICNGASTTLTASGASVYAWSNSLGSNSAITVSPSATTTYTVTITNTNGCTDTESATVTVNVLPVASISGVTTICNGTRTTLTASGA